MKVVIEFFRLRKTDKAHAVVGRETADAVDRDDAIATAGRLMDTLVMPQRPDGVTITDAEGAVLHSGPVSNSRDTAENDNDEDRKA